MYREGEKKELGNLWNNSTWDGWWIGDKELLRIEETNGDFISELRGFASRNVIQADGKIKQWMPTGNKLMSGGDDDGGNDDVPWDKGHLAGLFLFVRDSSCGTT